MKLPKVLITTYHEAFLHRGGGEFEISMISNALKKHGLVADIYGAYSQDIDNYDVFFHFSVEPGGITLLRRISELGKPIILNPNIFLNESNASLDLLVSEYIEIADIIIFKSLSEKNAFMRFFDLPLEKVRMLPQFIDAGIIRPAPKGLFSSLYGVKDYAIGIGRIEPAKRQKMAIKAANESNVPIVLIGNYSDYEYYLACKNEAPSNTIFIDSLPYHSDIMRSALQDSSLYIEISPMPAGYSAIEAGLSGCELVLADTPWSHEHFSGTVHYVNHESLESIKTGIEVARTQKKYESVLQKKLLHHLSDNNIKVLFDILLEV